MASWGPCRSDLHLQGYTTAPSMPSSRPTLFADVDQALEGATHTATTAAGMPEIQVSAPQARLHGDPLPHTLERAADPRVRHPRRLLDHRDSPHPACPTASWPRSSSTPTGPGSPGRTSKRPSLADTSADLRISAALRPSIARLEGAGNFDFVFIDADKINTPTYFAWALDHTRPGGRYLRRQRDPQRLQSSILSGDEACRGATPVPRVPGLGRGEKGDPDDDSDGRRQGFRRVRLGVLVVSRSSGGWRWRHLARPLRGWDGRKLRVRGPEIAFGRGCLPTPSQDSEVARAALKKS